MMRHASRNRSRFAYRLLSAFIAFTFAFNLVLPPGYAQVLPQTLLNLPVPGAMVTPTPAFVPVLLKGITIHPENPLQFDFIVDSGNTDFKEDQIKTESQRLVKYFLASMTIPKDDLWVNLSPYESDKIIPDELGRTELGRDMLAQDYILKQLTASLMYPEKELGKEFWARVYKLAEEKYGTTEIPVNTFNKVWILPDTATVYEHGQTVYIVEARLKVMLDSDYVAMQHETKDQRLKTKDFRSNESSVISLQSSVSSEIIKEIILPAIEKEVNEGQNFAPLRQIYHSLILAKWYKETIKNSLLSKVYVDQKKIAGVDTDDPTLKDQIYAQYMEAYKKGVFNYIKEDYDRLSHETIPRKYFSGGIDRLTNFSLIKLDKTSNPSRVASAKVGRHFALTIRANPQKDGAAIPKKSGSPVTERKAEITKLEIVRLVNKLNDRGIKPKIHGTDLLVFGDQRKDLFQFIQRFSVVKNPDDIRRILLWRLNAEKFEMGKEGGRPLSGIDPQTAKLIYDAVFNQDDFLKSYTKEKSLNIVLFRRGKSGRELTNLLKTIPNVKLKVILSATDDGESWFHAAREFKATGVPGAGKALVDLARDRQAKEFLEKRLPDDERSDDELAADFYNLVMKLENPKIVVRLSDKINAIYQTAMKIDVNKRLKLWKYLEKFWDMLQDSRKNRDSRFTFRGVPLRSLVLLGASIVFREQSETKADYWQAAINDIGSTILNVEDGNEIIFPTQERQHIVAVREDGTVYFSETGINEYVTVAPFLGLWLMNETIDREFIKEFSENLRNQHGIQINAVQLEPSQLGNPTLLEDVEETIRKVDPAKAKDVANIISGLSTTGKLSQKKVKIVDVAKNALDKADIILFADALLETNVGGALVVDGIQRAILDNKNAVKVSLAEIAEFDSDYNMPLDYLERTLRYMTGDMRYRTVNYDWTTADRYINYVLAGLLGTNDPLKVADHLHDIEKKTDGTVRAIAINAEKNTEYGFYSSTALAEAIISLQGLKAARFVVSDESGLMPESYAKSMKDRAKAQIGLFKKEKSVKALVSEIKQNWTRIVNKGAFVFDVDMTILPKKATALIDYAELAYLFMRLLREGVRVAIISGNSEEEQMQRIYNAIKAEMRDDLSAFKNLTFYVNGGATKIGFDIHGTVERDDRYNKAHSMEAVLLERAVNGALKEMAKDGFGLAPNQLEEFIRVAQQSYPTLRLETPWRNGEEWEPRWITPQEVSGELVFPWVEMRGKFTADGTDKIASITIKPTPKFELSGQKLDIRDALQGKIKEFLKEQTDNFGIRSGGSSSTDITNKNANKIAALLDFTEGNQLNMEWVFYFGDEFYKRTDSKTKNIQLGNDEVIAQEPRLQKVRTLAVNADDMEGAAKKTLWIGRSPQSTLEFLEEIIISSAEVAETHTSSPVSDEEKEYTKRTDERWTILKEWNAIPEKDANKALTRFSRERVAQPYRGLTTAAWVEPNTEVYRNLVKARNQLEAKLNEISLEDGTRLGDKIAWVKPESYHMTTYDLVSQKGFVRGQEDEEFQAQLGRAKISVQQGFETLAGIGTINTQVRGIGTMLPWSPALLVRIYPQSENDLTKIYRIREAMASQWPRELPPFIGHITLGYIVGSMNENEYQKLVFILEQYENKIFGDFSINEIQLREFSTMEDYDDPIARYWINGITPDSSVQSSSSAEDHHLSDAELRLLREPNEVGGFISKRGFDENRVKKQLARILSNIQWWETSPLLTEEDKRAIRQVEEQNFLAGPGTGDEHYMEEEWYQDLVRRYNAAAEKRRLIEAEKITEVVNWVKAERKNFKGEEVHILDGVGRDGKVIGRIDRKIAEKYGYIHETANVVLLTPDGKVLLQLRNKDNYDDHLAMYGGHLEVGQSHFFGAIKETLQETRLKLEELEGEPIPVDYEGYDEQAGEGDNNRERRSWFVKVLTENEYRIMKERKEAEERVLGIDKATTSHAEYKAKLFEIQKRGTGEGEVVGTYEVAFDKIAGAASTQNPESPYKDKTNKFLKVTDIFNGREETIDAFFTPDALERLVSPKNVQLWTKIKETAAKELSERKPPSDSSAQSSSALVIDEAFQREFLAGVEGDTRTFVMIKPDALERGQKEAVVREIERQGFAVEVGPEIRLTTAQASEFYQVHQDRPFFKDLITFITSGPVIPLFLKANGAVEKFNAVKDEVRKTLGVLDTKATSNRLHASDSMESAIAESQVIFNVIATQSSSPMTQKEAEERAEMLFSEGLRLLGNPRFISNYEEDTAKIQIMEAIMADNLKSLELLYWEQNFYDGPISYFQIFINTGANIDWGDDPKMFMDSATVVSVDVSSSPLNSLKAVINKNLIMKSDDKIPGGIDMNSIDLDRQGAGVDIQFDPAEFQEIIDAGIDGFVPVIINIAPLPSILPLLGLDPAIKEDLLELSAASG